MTVKVIVGDEEPVLRYSKLMMIALGAARFFVIKPLEELEVDQQDSGEGQRDPEGVYPANPLSKDEPGEYGDE